MSTTKQRTFKINNNKVTIKSRPQTYCRNLSGWYVFINGCKYFVNTLERRVAEDTAYGRWVKKNWWTAFNKAIEENATDPSKKISKKEYEDAISKTDSFSQNIPIKQ